VVRGAVDAGSAKEGHAIHGRKFSCDRVPPAATPQGIRIGINLLKVVNGYRMLNRVQPLARTALPLCCRSQAETPSDQHCLRLARIRPTDQLMAESLGNARITGSRKPWLRLQRKVGSRSACGGCYAPEKETPTRIDRFDLDSEALDITT